MDFNFRLTLPENGGYGSFSINVLVCGPYDICGGSISSSCEYSTPAEGLFIDYILFGSMALAVLALLWIHPELNTPAYRGGFSEEQGPVWPMLFVLVACGAVSGFHSLVAGGTTSKQLAVESQGKSYCLWGYAHRRGRSCGDCFACEWWLILG